MDEAEALGLDLANPHVVEVLILERQVVTLIERMIPVSTVCEYCSSDLHVETLVSQQYDRLAWFDLAQKVIALVKGEHASNDKGGTGKVLSGEIRDEMPVLSQRSS